MNFYEILKTKKLGRGSPDYWTQLFAEHIGGKGEWKVAELTGMLPIIFRSNGTALIDYRVYGIADSSGVQTENLFNFEKVKPNTGVIWTTGQEIYVDGRHLSDYIPVEAGEYTATFNVFFLLYSVQKDYVGYYDGSKFTKARDGVQVSASKLTIPYNGYVRFVSLGVIDPLKNFMFAKGSTLPSEHIPFGYKFSFTVTSGADSKTADVYIGDSKLGEAEYVDYSEQKIYRRILFMTHDNKHFITKDNKDFCLRRRGYSG